jgi:hypothetical protein
MSGQACDVLDDVAIVDLDTNISWEPADGHAPVRGARPGLAEGDVGDPEEHVVLGPVLLGEPWCDL